MMPVPGSPLRRWLCLLGTLLLPTWAMAEEWLPRHPDSAFRVLAWNVSREQFFTHEQEVASILRAIDADVLLLDEMSGQRSAADLEARLEALAEGQDWHSLYGSSGGANQRATLSARAPLIDLPVFQQLSYPAEVQQMWLDGLPPPVDRADVRQNLEWGLPAVGGVLQIDGRRVLFVGMDLQCCGKNPSEIQAQRRIYESYLLREAIETSVAQTQIDAVVVGGDFNAVTGRAPVEIVATPLRAGTPALSVAEATHRDGRSQWTWEGTGTPFPNGRLDFVLHSAPLKVLAAQVFDSADLSAAERARWGLSLGSAQKVSAHRPVVVDFGWVDKGR